MPNGPFGPSFALYSKPIPVRPYLHRGARWVLLCLLVALLSGFGAPASVAGALAPESLGLGEALAGLEAAAFHQACLPEPDTDMPLRRQALVKRRPDSWDGLALVPPAEQPADSTALIDRAAVLAEASGGFVSRAIRLDLRAPLYRRGARITRGPPLAG